jgi:hypothetical protein
MCHLFHVELLYGDVELKMYKATLYCQRGLVDVLQVWNKPTAMEKVLWA